MSGIAAERDQSKTPEWMPEYCLMRVSAPSTIYTYTVSESPHPRFVSDSLPVWTHKSRDSADTLSRAKQKQLYLT